VSTASDTPRVVPDEHGGVRALIKLARPHQWSKTAFVFVGPAYAAQAAPDWDWPVVIAAVLLTAAAFCLASSGCYVFNDVSDVERDRLHPRKRTRPIASGAISQAAAVRFGVGLLAGAVVLGVLVPGGGRWWVLGLLGFYVANVTAYSISFKQRAIVDVMSLSIGFVVRVGAGCAAVGVAPTTWLLNVTLFLAMTLAIGKRLGERRTADSKADAVAIRGVQRAYSDDVLRMLLVVSAVATLMTYAAYVVTRQDDYGIGGFNLLWLTMLPATYGLLRAIMLLERGRYDDPTELAVGDRPFQLAATVFGAITVGLIAYGWYMGGVERGLS